MEYRELLARAKAFFDLNVWNREPRFYGKKEPVIYKD
jgi:vancomycin permeability regulator SanA